MLSHGTCAGSGELEFEEFVTLAAQFLGEEETVDPAAMLEELKEAFRLYDKEGQYFVPNTVLLLSFNLPMNPLVVEHMW